MKGAEYNKLEKKQAKKDGADLVKNSGRNFRKGDAETDSLLIDYKYTSRASFSISLKAFKKHEQDAWREGNKAPAIVVIFQENGKELAIVDWSYLQELEEKSWKYDDLCK